MTERATAEDKAAGEEAGIAGVALLRPTGSHASDPPFDGRLQLARISGLPVQLDVRVPLPNFRVGDLMALAPGRVVPSAWPSTDDVPLTCGDVHLVWTEFEVVDQTLAVRVTRLV
ncbi:hypothetical protein ACPOL_0130 [Acidisarcina polymorpha]|uniref:Flagellar motor switch protein FliN-like C-terminal domain-containing protein n=2 Tax=Acidisarcina polymorpha TaxID=2211140 RepID=A0A2Z5FSQ5_9BACT|nr:hypothetical protein ACPOL_0130 [Acidisarcina polymorpha]